MRLSHAVIRLFDQSIDALFEESVSRQPEKPLDCTKQQKSRELLCR